MLDLFHPRDRPRPTSPVLESENRPVIRPSEFIACGVCMLKKSGSVCP